MSERLHQRCACGSELSSAERFEGLGDTSSFTFRGTDRVYERARPFRIEHILLDLRIDHAARALSGTADLCIERVSAEADEIRLDAVGFDIDAVQVQKGTRPGKQGWRAAKYVYDGETLSLAVPARPAGTPRTPATEHLVVRVKYRAEPRRGMYFLEPDAEVPARPTQVWTQCQDEDARHIFPCHDKPHIKQTMDIRVVVERGWFVLSNGDLVNGVRAQKNGEFHYRMEQPQSSYLFTIVAGRFAVLQDKVGSLPVTYYVPPGREDDGWRTFKSTPEMIRLFSKLTGVPYPWTKYAQVVVHDFIFGGMENTGATTLYEHVLYDERAAIDISSDDLISHELAHQWFGDLVTCRDWSHAWLNEGFATYMEHVWREHDLGRDEYHHGLRVDLHAYLGEAAGRYQRPVVCQDYEAPIDVFDRHLYEKGALFLHTLRLELGDEVFWRGIQRYLGEHARDVAETRDLMRVMEDVSGKSLEQLFEQGLFRAGHPRLEVSINWDAGMLVAAVTQSLDEGASPFAFDLELEIAHGKGKRPVRERRRVSRARHTFAFEAPERPRFAVIDPEHRIIGRVNVKAPADMLRNQLLEAPSGRGRVQAADALGKKDDPPTIRALGEALSNARNFWGVRASAASALGNIRSDAAFRELKTALRARHPKVRRAAAAALGNFRTSEAAKTLSRVANDDESYLVAAAACRALGDTRQTEAFSVLVDMLDRPSWADTVMSGAVEGLSRLRDDRGVEHVRERTRYGVSDRGRRAAVAALAAMSTTRSTREALEALLDDKDPHLRVAVVLALAEIGDPKSRPPLQRILEHDLDARVRRRTREVLRDLSGKPRRETRRLREDLERVRRSHDELAARLSKLEERAAAAAKQKPRKKR